MLATCMSAAMSLADSLASGLDCSRRRSCWPVTAGPGWPVTAGPGCLALGAVAGGLSVNTGVGAIGPTVPAGADLPAGLTPRSTNRPGGGLPPVRIEV
jgi:hypothetical protein